MMQSGDIQARPIPALLDKEIWMSAGRLIEKYGDDALKRAAQETEYNSILGNAEIEEVWTQVTTAVALLMTVENELPN